MGSASSSNLVLRYLPQALGWTAALTLIPLAVVWELRASGAASAPWACIPLAVALSLAITALGSAYWRRRTPAPELLFSELMPWGFYRRVRSERQIASATALLQGAGELFPERRAHLLQMLAGALAAHDPYTVGHSHRVARHSATVARKLGLRDDEVRRIRAAAAIHDVGKLNVDREVLTKPARLTDEEYELIKTHSAAGAALAAPIGDPELSAIIRHHHERLDGSGYPDGLRGQEIPLGARIIAVTDTFDAVTSARAYRPARPHKRALAILSEESRVKLDRDVVEAFIACYAGRRAVALWAALAAAPQTGLAALSRSTPRAVPVRVTPSRALSSGAVISVIAAIALALPVASHHHTRHPPPPASVAAASVLPPHILSVSHHRLKPPAAPPFARPQSPAQKQRPQAPPIPLRQIAARARHVPPTHHRAPGPRQISRTPTVPAPTRPTAPATPSGPPSTAAPTTPATPSGPPSTAAPTTPASAPSGCKNGAWVHSGYPNQGQCVAASHQGAQGNGNGEGQRNGQTNGHGNGGGQGNAGGEGQGNGQTNGHGNGNGKHAGAGGRNPAHDSRAG